MRARWIRISLAAVLAILLVVVLLPTLVSEPLRRMMERNANNRLQGYSLTIGKVRLHPLTFSLDLLDTVVLQHAHPDPPMARIPRFSATVHWRALVHRRLVADVLFDRPQFHITVAQAAREARDRVGIQERGWQEALLAIYPLQVNLLRIRDGQVVYVDRGPFKPLELSRVNFRADNIRNVWSPERVYPSDLSLDAVVFGTGRLAVNGSANFLAVPHPGVMGDINLEGVRLNYFRPLIERAQLTAREGSLSAQGEFEFAPAIQSAHLRQVTIAQANLQYIHGAATARRERQVRQKIAQEAKQAANEPGVRYRVDRLTVRDSKLGFLNEATRPPYLVALEGTEIQLTNVSSQGAEGPAKLVARGRFMGSGATTLIAEFRPDAKSLDLLADVHIQGTDMTAMNNLLRAHGKFDVRGGEFSLFSRMRIRDGQIRGYVKPLFQKMNVWDPEQDRHKPLKRRLFERAVGGVAAILENRVRDEVATVADLSGRVGNPNTSTLQIVVRLIQNAFFKAILPGFERHRGRPA
jgi:hypothetical protein